MYLWARGFVSWWRGAAWGSAFSVLQDFVGVLLVSVQNTAQGGVSRFEVVRKKTSVKDTWPIESHIYSSGYAAIRPKEYTPQILNPIMP